MSKKNKKKKTIKINKTKWINYVILVVGLVGLGWYGMSQMLPYYLGMQGDLLPGQTGEYDFNDDQGEFHGLAVKSEPVEDAAPGVVLGSGSEGAKKHIEVDLTRQRLYAFEDGKKIAEFMVSTGKWGRTPTGTYRIWSKYRATKMEGGSSALHTYYYLPNVPFVMFFYNDDVPKKKGFSIHGTYWHSNFGEVMSHGCVNMRTRDVEKLYHWANPDVGDKKMVNAAAENPGTEVIIYGEAP